MLRCDTPFGIRLKGCQSPSNNRSKMDGFGPAPASNAIRRKPNPPESRYVAAVDVKRAADLYAQGRTLRQIGAELSAQWSTVGQQFQKAGITMRSAGPPAHAASTQKILELRDQGLSWTEVAEQVGMTFPVRGAGTGGPGRPNVHVWAVGSRFLPMHLIRTWRLAFERWSLIISVEPRPVRS